MPVHAHKCDVTSSFCEILAGSQQRAVFDRTRDQRAARSLKMQSRIDDRIIRLCAAAGENNFRRFTAKQRSYPLPRKIYGFSSHGREAVPTRRVTVILG